MVRIVPSTCMAWSRNSAPVMPFAQPEPISAPIEVPEITDGFSPSSSIASMKGMWVRPRAEPPPSATPIRGMPSPVHTRSSGGSPAM